jgi:uncharacterized protein (DUF2267 family)
MADDDTPRIRDAETFLETVAQVAGRLSLEDAERATQATLETLAERIADGEARDLAAQLPPEIAPHLATTSPAEGFDAEEFVRRVAEREGVDVPTAERHVAAVFVALDRTVSRQEVDDLVAELPSDFLRLLARGPAVEIVSVETFLDTVAAHAPVDREGAERAAKAVLEVLAERIAGGEVEDLMLHLPRELHPPLRRGLERSGGKATRMSLDAFVQRVAQQEGVSPLDAREHVHAVFVALRAAVGDREFFDVTSQLPGEYRQLLVG